MYRFFKKFKKKWSLFQKRKNKHALLLLMTALSFLPISCWAASPLATEDAGVKEQGECEFEMVAGRLLSPKISVGSGQLGCGIGFKTELAFSPSKEIGQNSNTAHLTFSGKTSLRTLNENQAGVAIAYAVWSGKEKSNAMKYETAEVKTVVTVPYQSWLLHANAGLSHICLSHENRVTWAIAAERLAAVKAVDLTAEIFGDTKSDPWVQVGARWNAVPDRLFFNVSYGIQTNENQSRLMTVGLTLAF